ncbi:MAG: nucleoside kinase [Bacilli bacterium]|nr:nucleoside kinase [Bacilli bacterium]
MFTVKVKYLNNIYTYEKGKTLLDISSNFSGQFKYDVIIGSINNKLTELTTKIEKDCNIDFFDLLSLQGNKVYERGIIYLFIYAVKKALKCEVEVEHSIDRGIYMEILNKELTDEDIILIEDKMKETISKSIPFEKLSVLRSEAIDYYASNNQKGKAECLKYISNTDINLYKFDDMYDYFYGEMPINSSPLKYFKLTKVGSNGIVLRFPNIYSNGEIEDYISHEKLFGEFRNYHKWCNTIKTNNVADLNKTISDGTVANLIYMSETEQNNRLYGIAEHIKNNRNIKVILIAGPSSSGKTTTSKKLSLYLKNFGISPHHLSMDDYYVNREDNPKDENGEYDFECIKAINIELFNKQLNELLNGEEVLLPQFNFLIGKCEFKEKRLKLEDDDILIIEGLHALNDDLTPAVDPSNKYKIYLSPLTSINIDGHNRITTSDNRLLRRIIRDNQYRNQDASTTLDRWKYVRKGEEKNVFPFQDNADIIFNTSLIYELGILKVYGEPLLFSVKESDPNYGEAIRLINLLRNVLPITSANIPLDSIIREFIGDSYFKE